MAITSNEIVSVLQIQSTASLISGAATITDVSNYSSIGVATPDVVKVLLWIQDSTGETFYKNTGYDAADFSSPDLVPLTSPTTYSFTLPTDVTGAYVQGQYNVNMKVQVNQSSVYTEASSRLYMNVCSCCNGIVANVEGNVSYNTAVVSVVDNTNYKSWTALTNTLVIYPPTNTGSPQTEVFHGAPATLYYEPPIGTFPYTGMWQWTLTSDISYVDSLTGTTTTCRITGQGSFNVVQSQLCKVRCLLDKYRTEFYQLLKLGSLNAGQIEQQTKNWNLASDDYLMAFASERCGLPQTTIDKYIANIYLITGIDPNCDCGCGDGTSQPLVPTSNINGTDGTDGLSFLQGTTVPDGALGVVGDSYLDTTTYDIYKKTGASTWTVTANIKGATGATGADGANGASVLVNQYPNLATLGTGWESLAEGRTPYTMPANTLSGNGDELYIRAIFTLPAKPTFGQTVRVIIDSGGGSPIPLYFNINIQKFQNIEQRGEINVRLTRVSATSIKFNQTWNTYSVIPNGYAQARLPYTTGVITSAIASLATFDHTIDCQANSNYVGDIVCESFEVIYYKYTS